MYTYPHNMSAKATLWLWTLKDLSISGSCLLAGFFLFAEFSSCTVLVAGATYAFLTIRFDDTSMLEVGSYGLWLFFGLQEFLWVGNWNCI